MNNIACIIFILIERGALNCCRLCGTQRMVLVMLWKMIVRGYTRRANIVWSFFYRPRVLYFVVWGMIIKHKFGLVGQSEMWKSHKIKNAKTYN